MNTWNADWIGAHTWNAAASYVTGANSMKFGYQGAYPRRQSRARRQRPVVPRRQRRAEPVDRADRRLPHATRASAYYAFYAQDQWTRDRLTVQGAVRFDHPWSNYPEQSIGGVRVPAGRDHVPGVAGRRGLQRHHAADGRWPTTCRGNGKTALKFNMGRYLEAAVNGNGNYSALLPASRVPTSVTRTWTDRERRLRARLRSVERRRTGSATPVDFCGADQPAGVRPQQPDALLRPGDHAGLGRPAGRLADRRHPPARSAAARVDGGRLHPPMAPELHGHRQSGAGRVGLRDRSASRRRSIRGCRAAAATWSPGSSTPIQNVVGVTDNYRTYAPNYGNQYSIYNGFDLSVNARLRNGIQLQAGSSTGSQVTDNCEVRAKLPEIGDSRRPSAQPVTDCHYRAGDHDPSHGRRLVHDPEDRRAAQRHVPEQPRHLPGRELHRVQRRRWRRRSDGRCPATPPTSPSTCSSPATHGASGSISSTSASARCCASAGSGPPSRPTCSTR